MNDIYEALENLAASGGRGVLAEIESTEGSSPRKAGARMLLSPDGSFSGTVGGGALEYHAQQDALTVHASGTPLRKTYSLGGDSGEAIGAVCGGSAVLRFRPIGPGEAAVLLAERPPRPRVLVYGAGHVAKALADALRMLDIPVVVTDERAEILTEERFPAAERRLCPADKAPIDPGPGDCIVIMTHGHAHDYDLLLRAMRTDAAYIGVMASRKKAALFRRRLLADGVTQEAVDTRLRSPVGLAIAAETPEEIAVSITAELIRFLRTGR